MFQVVLLNDIPSEITLKPYGPYAIANVLRQNGYSVIVIDLVSEFTLNELYD